MKTCVECAEDLEKDAVFCEFCHAPQVNTNHLAPRKPKPALPAIEGLNRWLRQPQQSEFDQLGKDAAVREELTFCTRCRNSYFQTVDLSCPNCNRKPSFLTLSDEVSLIAANSDPISNSTGGGLEAFDPGGHWRHQFRRIKKVFLVTGTVVTIFSMIVMSTLTAGLGGKPVDQERACNFFSVGYQAAIKENVSDYGMSLWKASARDAAQYARGQLSFELQRFAAGTTDKEIIANITLLCR